MRPTNRERVLHCITAHADGIDDDEISEKLHIKPRQQIYQIATGLEQEGLIHRESVNKPGKRRKIHNFPVQTTQSTKIGTSEKHHARTTKWEKRLAALVAATGLSNDEILDQALEAYAREFLKGQTD